MKIAHLLILSVTVLFVIYSIHGYFTYEFTINEAKKTTLLRSQAQANNIMQDLDKYINQRLADFQALTKIKQIQTSVMESNQEFNTNPNLKKLLTQSEANESYDEVPFLNGAESGGISKQLRDFIISYKNEYDYDLVSEMFVTNQYGANIALATGKSDYSQADEDWWQITKNKENYIGQLVYDENYNDYVIPIAYPILDDSSKYIGTIRVVVSLKVLLHDFLSDADLLKEAKKAVVLVDDAGDTVYENGEFFPPSGSKDYLSLMDKENGSFEVGFPDTKLISYATSIGYRDFPGFGWTVVIEQESSVIDEFESLERNFLISTLVGITSAAILGVMLSMFVTNPLGRLSKLTTLLGKGDFNVQVQKSRISEINSIMNSFKEMEVSLKKLFETEKQLTEANTRIKNERLTAIGELAASMAHDMKNPLGTIKSGMDILKRTSELKPETGEVLQRMDRAVSRMSHQVEDVLNYIRRTPLSIKPNSIKSIIKSAINSLEVPKQISIEIEDKDVTVSCDEKKMEIVFINLILNSIQAIGQDDGKIAIRIGKSEDSAQIEIEDSGSGVSEKIVSDMFKPLVTTKQKGTGLGLASCKNIVEQHGGAISFQNNPTIFKIVLPIEQSE